VTKTRYCGRNFTAAELDLIRSIIARPEEYPTRAAIARAACQSLAWVKLDGGLKVMSARVALLRMHRDGLFELPSVAWWQRQWPLESSTDTCHRPGSATHRHSPGPRPSHFEPCSLP